MDRNAPPPSPIEKNMGARYAADAKQRRHKFQKNTLEMDQNVRHPHTLRPRAVVVHLQDAAIAIGAMMRTVEGTAARTNPWKNMRVYK